MITEVTETQELTPTRELKVDREQVLPRTPDRVFRAVATTEGNVGWLYPMDVEPRLGGAVSRGSSTVVAWDPPHEFACRTPDLDGFTNTLSYRVEPHPDGSLLRMGIHWVHTGTPDDGWDTRADAAERHVDFYQHSLAEYLRHFDGRPATYVKASRPGPPTSPDAFDAVRERLGVPPEAAAGDVVRALLPGGPVEVQVDHRDGDFLGLRGPDGLYRFYNGARWGWPLWVGHHLFTPVPDTDDATWDTWLTETAP